MSSCPALSRQCASNRTSGPAPESPAITAFPSLVSRYAQFRDDIHMELVTSTDALAAFCKRAAEFDFVTVDTEFLRETTYWPKLCLAAGGNDRRSGPRSIRWPIASISSRSLSSWPTTRIVKVFHAARQDIEIFVKLDRQGAAQHLRHPDRRRRSAALATASPMTTWCARSPRSSSTSPPASPTGRLRPLTEKQQRLRAGRRHPSPRRLSRAASSRSNGTAPLGLGRRRTRRARARIDTYVVQPEHAWERLKTKLNKPRDLAALKALAAWRERKRAGHRPAAQPRPQGRCAGRARRAASAQPPMPSTSCAPCSAAMAARSAAAEIIALLKDVEALRQDRAAAGCPTAIVVPRPRAPSATCSACC